MFHRWFGQSGARQREELNWGCVRRADLAERELLGGRGGGRDFWRRRPARATRALVSSTTLADDHRARGERTTFAQSWRARLVLALAGDASGRLAAVARHEVSAARDRERRLERLMRADAARAGDNGRRARARALTGHGPSRVSAQRERREAPRIAARAARAKRSSSSR